MEERSIINPISHRKQIQLLIVRFVVAIVLKSVIEQTLYQAIGKQMLLNLVVRRWLHKSVFQKIICHIIVIKLFSWFVKLILLFILMTSRITIVGEKELRRMAKERQRVIFAFWHGDYTLLLFSFRIKKAVVLVHSSFRGNYVAQLASAFNYRIVRTPRHGRSIMSFIKAIKEGYSGFIAVDGPLGPPHEAKLGTILIARKLGAKIIPLGVQAQRGLLLRKRWDNHYIPLPFNDITVSVGEPIVVKADDSLQLKGEEVTKSLFELSKMKRKISLFGKEKDESRSNI